MHGDSPFLSPLPVLLILLNALGPKPARLCLLINGGTPYLFMTSGTHRMPLLLLRLRHTLGPPSLAVASPRRRHHPRLGSLLPLLSLCRALRAAEAVAAVAEPVAVDWLDEIAQGCRRQLQRLGWNAAQLVQFIAEKFDGRRRAQLRDDELVLLLYHLQSVDEGG